MKTSISAQLHLRDLFETDPKMTELKAARADNDAKREQESKAELAKMSQDDQKLASDIIKNFGDDTWRGYASTFNKDIGGDDVEVSIRARKGTETYAALSTVNFLKKYDANIAREGIAKEYYDSPWSWVSDPDSDNYQPRDSFKSKISLSNLDIDPDWRTYEAWWDDGGMYGYHSFTDEGSIDDMKVRYRMLQG